MIEATQLTERMKSSSWWSSVATIEAFSGVLTLTPEGIVLSFFSKDRSSDKQSCMAEQMDLVAKVAINSKKAKN